jgi:tungstate transport system ATP-binding protein
MSQANHLTSEVLLQLHNVGVRFGAVQALSGVSLDVRRGDVLALVGPNGAGKTTLLRVLHGQVRCSGQRVLQPGQPGGGALRQAMVFQRPFVLRLSVQANLQLALWLAGVPRGLWAATAQRALQRVGLAGLQARPARALSGGQLQRLALARAWATAPELLFLDEPTASLDPGAKNEVEALLAGFAADGMTVVMSTHNLGQAKRLATRVVYVEAGEVLADLPTPEFFGGVLPPRVQAFLDGESWRAA